MKQRIIAIGLCLLLSVGLSGCRLQEDIAERESSGGSGYGAVRKSVLTEQDLYFFNHTTTREEVLAELGTPQESMLTVDNGAEYQLKDGRTLSIVYSPRNIVQTAVLTDSSGAEQSLFDYLGSLGILKTVGFSPDRQPEETPEHSETEEPETPSAGETITEVPTQTVTDTEYFSARTYTYAVAEQILVEGALRETVVSAFGKPNRFASVTYEEDSYIIDVYVMEDGGILYADYGYLRNSLRAVRKVKDGLSSDYLGTWGVEEKPQGFYRITKNQALFTSVKKGSTPSTIFKRFGEPDWLTGDEQHWRAAYQLQNNAVLYFDFGEGGNQLSSAHIRKEDGSISIFALR